MTRDITSAVSTETDAKVVRPFTLVEMLFEGDPVRVWNGVEELDWDGKTWTGVGYLGGIEPLEETTSLSARGIAFSLTGVPQETIALALASDYHGRLAKVYQGFFDEDGSIIDDPFVINEGFMDQMVISEEGETAQITVRAESRLITLQRPRVFLYDNEDQQALFAGDRGFEFVPALQNKEITWGVGSGRMNGPRRIRRDPSGPLGGAGQGGAAGSGGVGPGPGPSGGAATGAGAGAAGGGGASAGSGPGPGAGPAGGGPI